MNKTGDGKAHTINKAERKQPDHDNHHHQEYRVLELNPPPHSATGDPHKGKPPRQQHEADHDPGSPRQKAQPQFAPPRPCGGKHRRQLDRQHRQHAWHEIENKTAKDRDQHDAQKRAFKGAVRRLARRGIITDGDQKRTSLRRRIHRHGQRHCAQVRYVSPDSLHEQTVITWLRCLEGNRWHPFNKDIPHLA